MIADTSSMDSLMLAEACASAARVREQWAENEDRLTQLGEALRQHPPSAVLTVARGSSDHAAAYMAYLVMARLGRIAVSLPMSLVTLYHAPLQAQNTLAIAVSQSGQSPDVVAPIQIGRAHA